MTIRAQIFEQHDGLRLLLRRALVASTRGLLERDEPSGLSATVFELRDRFEAHLLFEERSLLPVLAALGSWAPETTRALRKEHARQRAELDALVEGTVSDWDVERTALALRSLATDLLLDMREEERGCLSLLRDAAPVGEGQAH